MTTFQKTFLTLRPGRRWGSLTSITPAGFLLHHTETCSPRVLTGAFRFLFTVCSGESRGFQGGIY